MSSNYSLERSGMRGQCAPRARRKSAPASRGRRRHAHRSVLSLDGIC
jgi:hypothetical protein